MKLLAATSLAAQQYEETKYADNGNVQHLNQSFSLNISKAPKVQKSIRPSFLVAKEQKNMETAK